MIKNCAKDCLDKIFVQLPKILNQKSTEFLKVMNEYNHKLNWTVSDSSNYFVEYFVSYCEIVKQVASIQYQKDRELTDINGLSNLIQEYKIKYHENIRV